MKIHTIPCLNGDWEAIDTDSFDVCADPGCNCRRNVIRGIGSSEYEAVENFVYNLLDEKDIRVADIMLSGNPVLLAHLKQVREILTGLPEFPLIRKIENLVEQVYYAARIEQIDIINKTIFKDNGVAASSSAEN